jgi:hypothetical protein
VWTTPSMHHLAHLNTHAHTNVVHQAAIRLVRFTPYDAALHQSTGCGFQLLTAGDDLKIVVWHIHSGRVSRVLLGHKDLIFDVVFSASELLFTASADGNVLVWDWKHSGALLGSYARETGGIRSLALLEQFHKLVVACFDGSVALWDARRHERVGDIKPDKEWAEKYRKGGPTNGGWIDAQKFHTGQVHATRLSPDGQLLATAAADATVKLWSVLSFRRDGASLAAARAGVHAARSHLVPLDAPERDAIERLDGEEAPLDIGYHGTLLHTLRHEGPVTHALFTPDSCFVLTAAQDQSVRVWLVETGALVYQVNVPAPIIDLSFAHAPDRFDGGVLRGQKHFYLGRIHVSVTNRVLVMDMAVLESVVVVPPATDPSMAVANWPPSSPTARASSKSVTTNKTRRRRHKRERDASRAATRAAASKEVPAIVCSDPLLGMFLPGARQLHAELGDMLALTAASLSFAPNFLHQLLEGPEGSGVDRRQLVDNMRHFGLTATYLLRIVSATTHFRPGQVLQGFARRRPDCHPMFKLAFAGVPVEAAMIDMGFLPHKVGGAGGSSALAQLDRSGRVYTAPVDPHANADGSNAFGRDTSAQPFQFIPGAEGDGFGGGGGEQEGFFFAPGPPTASGGSTLVEQPEQNLVHWEPATQLNLLAHLASNAPVAPVHAEAALDPQHVKYALFGMPRAAYVDSVEQLAARRRGALGDPYGGARDARTQAALEHELAEQGTATRAHERVREAHAAAATGNVHKGYTFSATGRSDSTVPGSLNLSLTASSIPSVPSIPSSASALSALDPALFASFVAGQVVPNGERSDPGSGGHSARLASLTAERRVPARLGSMSERALTKSVAIPLRKSIGLKPTSTSLNDEDSRAALQNHAGPAFGRRTFHKPSRAENHNEVRTKMQEFRSDRSAPVSLNQLLETFSATEIERKLAGEAAGVGGKASVDKVALDRATKFYAGPKTYSHASKLVSAETSARTAAAALALRDHDLRQEIRHTLLHQTNSLTALDTELSSGSSGAGGQVRDYTHAQQQLMNPFGGGGSSGLTMVPHTSAHALVGSGIAQTWHTGRPRVRGVHGFSDEYTSRSDAPAPKLVSPMHQFSSHSQFTFALPTAETKDARDVFPGMTDVFRPPTTATTNVETQLQKAYAAEKQHKWINKFSMESVHCTHAECDLLAFDAG